MRRICLALLLLMFFVLPASALDFVTETVDEGSDQGRWTSLARENDGTPHMVFLADGSMKLKYATFDGEDWTTQTIPAASGYLSYPSIALDNDGNPHVAFRLSPSENNEIVYAHSDGTEWVTETVKAEADSIKNVSIVLDSEGLPHVGYQTTSYDFVTSTNIKYISRSIDTWQDAETVVSFDYSCNNFVMALDNQDIAHLIYEKNYYNSPHYYLTFDGQNWTEPQLMEGIENVEHLSMTVDSPGTPYISYYDDDNSNLKYAFQSGDEWETSTVDSDYQTGRYSSIKVDSDGNVHISYYDSYDENLNYAFLDGSEWTLTTVDSQDYVGSYTSLALDASGNPAISYYDSTNYDLKYTSFDGETWSIQTVPVSGPPTGYAPEIALDSNEGPHMIYSAQTNDALVYAWKEGSEWQKQVIVSQDVDLRIKELTSEGFRGEEYNACLAMDDNDTPHVLYGDSVYYEEEIAPQYKLNYGVPSDDSWDFEALPFNLPYGDTEFYSLAVEGNGTPHISFVGSPFVEYSGLGSSGSSYSLWYSVKSGDLWTTSSVDQEGDFGMNAIALDYNNTPHICYFKEASISDETFSANDSDGYELKYATLSADEWVTQSVSSDLYGYELYCDLAVDSNGIPHIAFVKPSENLDVESMATSLSRYESYELFYATLVDEEWNTVLVDTLGYFRDGKISIQVDSYDNPHITYGLNERADLIIKETATQTGESELKYAYYDGSSWYTETLATGTMYGFGLQSSLALTSTNIPHIAYFTGTGVNYMTVPQEEAELIASSGDGCNLAIFSPAMALLVLPLLGLFRNRK